MNRTRWEGLLLFLFIPLVLVLLTRPPAWLGPGWGLLAAVGIIAAHRAVARPWALRRAARRSLWSGVSLSDPPDIAVAVRSGKEVLPFQFANADEAVRATQFLSFASRHRIALRIGVFLPLLTLVAAIVQEAIAGQGLFANQRAAALIFFRGGVATTVLAAALLHRRFLAPAPSEPLPFPFPIHNLALVGIRNTLGVFLAVGCYWVGLSIYDIATWSPR